jgi:hypothetical protein
LQFDWWIEQIETISDYQRQPSSTASRIAIRNSVIVPAVRGDACSRAGDQSARIDRHTSARCGITDTDAAATIGAYRSGDDDSTEV